MLDKIGACTVLATVSVAAAQNVVNGTFESPALLPNGYTATAPPGWLNVTGGTIGVFYPTMESWGYVAPQGHQLFYANGSMAEQVYCQTLQPDQTYVLTVDIVHRPGFFGGYTVEMRAGDTVLVTDSDTLQPPPGGFEVLELVYVSTPDDPAIGEPLSIRIGGPTQANFDEVGFSVTCRADCNGDGNLNILDFVCFQGLFATGASCADCNEDGQLNILDFVCYQSSFAAGCQ